MAKRMSFIGTILFAALIAGLFPSPVCAGAIHFVDQNATDAPHDGSNWCQSFVTLDEALAVAQTGDTIRVADGLYRPDQTGLADPREATFLLVSGVTLEGGYAGCGAADPDGRDINLFVTTLSGDLSNDDVLLTTQPDCQNAGGTWYGVLCDRVLNNSENSYHVVVSLDNDDATILDGFTISHGHADGPGFGPSPDSKEQGSGINIYQSTPQIRNCTIENNRSDNHGALNDHGGATITDCEFRGNFSINWGGALHNHRDITTTLTDSRFVENATAGAEAGGGAMFSFGTPAVANCIFENNRSAQSGGAVYCGEGSVPTFDACTFENNAASAVRGGGGMFNAGGSRTTMSDSLFLKNSAPQGGGLWNSGDTTVLVTGCTFQENMAVPGPMGLGGAGGGVGSYPGANFATFLDCIFLANSATGLSPIGGGLWAGGQAEVSIDRCAFIRNTSGHSGAAMQLDSPFARVANTIFRENSAEAHGGALSISAFELCFAEPELCDVAITNCLFVRNTALWGGAFDAVFANATIRNCSFVGNEATNTGGGLRLLFGVRVDMLNCILWNNLDSTGLTETAQVSIYDPNEVVLVPSFNNIQGLTGALGGVGNIAADPLFVDADGLDDILGTEDDNLRLGPGSPAIDAGANFLATIGTDLDGLPRFVDDFATIDTGSGSSPITDMGAYEFHTDCNANGIPDEIDIAAGTSTDGNQNGVPDRCETPPPQPLVHGPRYLVMRLDLAPSTVPIALRVTPIDHPCLTWYVNQSGRLVDYVVLMTPDQWETARIHGPEVIPGESYTVDVLSYDGSQLFTSTMTTARWGDTTGSFNGTAWNPPDGTVNITDAVAVLDGFRNLSRAPDLTWIDLFPQTPNGSIDITDAAMVIAAFTGRPYPFDTLDPCP